MTQQVNDPQSETISALLKIGDWAVYKQLVLHGGNGASAAALVSRGMVETREVETKTYPIKQWRVSPFFKFFGDCVIYACGDARTPGEYLWDWRKPGPFVDYFNMGMSPKDAVLYHFNITDSQKS